MAATATKKRGLDTATDSLEQARKAEPLPEDPRIVRFIGVTEDASHYTWNIPIGLLTEKEQAMCLEISDDCDEDPRKKQSPTYTFVDDTAEDERNSFLYKIGVRLGLVDDEIDKKLMDLRGASVKKTAGRPIYAVVVACVYC